MTLYVVTKTDAYSPNGLKCAMHTEVAGCFEDACDAVNFLNFMSVEGVKCRDFCRFADPKLPKESLAKWQEDDGTWIKYEIHELVGEIRIREPDADGLHVAGREESK